MMLHILLLLLHLACSPVLLTRTNIYFFSKVDIPETLSHSLLGMATFISLLYIKHDLGSSLYLI